MELNRGNQFVGVAAQLLPLILDPSITDILINGSHSLFIEREGKLIEEPTPFSNRGSLLDFIERILIPIGKRVDAAHPYLDGRLLDGSRFHIILPPIAPGGPLISIRKVRALADPVPIEAFGEPSAISWLSSQVTGRRNILIAGGTGVGKTTLLSRLMDQIPNSERLVTVEETLEIHSHHLHVARLEARSASPDGTGEVTLRDLIRNTLRMRPDRIILGECRGAEAFDMLQAMNTGHNGSLTTLHANGARDALRRLETLVLMAGLQAPLSAIREWIGHTIHVVVYLERAASARQIKEVVGVHGLEGEVYRILPHCWEGLNQKSMISSYYH